MQSKYLTALAIEQREDLEKFLPERQSRRCFICNEPIDLTLHAGQLDINHIDVLVEKGYA